MEMGQLRKIGQKIFQEMAALRNAPDIKTSLGIGAGGDKTFPLDKKAEDIIISGLDELDEPFSLISEEAGIIDFKGGGTRVIVDPVDGSRNAISGIPFFCTSIAAAEGDTIGDVNMAYVVNLVTGDEFWAERGAGAYLNGRQMTAQKDDSFYLVAYEAQTPGRDIPRILPLISRAHKTRCFGAIALDLAYLAFGAVSVFVSPSPSRSFDFAGGWLLAREAGGIVTDMSGEEIGKTALGLKRSVSLLASGSEKLHTRALGLLSGV
jgi:myo-inositol-1(or 4)-monophosphatase